MDKLKTNDVVKLYSAIVKELKERGVIRTKNVLGDLGEYLAIEHYNSTPNLPTLTVAPIGTKNIDAISRDGERYSIKSTTNKTTGVFYGLEPKGSDKKDKQKFEYVIICIFDDDFDLNKILELDWENFLVHKRWHNRMNAWNLNLSKNVVKDCKIIFEK